MLSPREFLLQECRNVEELLLDALRYDYGPMGSRFFVRQLEYKAAWYGRSFVT